MLNSPIVGYVMLFLLLACSFIFKLYFQNKPSGLEFMTALLAVPVDILFLAISLIIAFTISEIDKNQTTHVLAGIVISVIYIIIAAISTITWRFSLDNWIQNQKFRCFGIGILNLLFSVFFILVSIRIHGGEKLWQTIISSLQQ